MSTETVKQKELFGHPIGLYILFFTEMWERFSYYGMRAILVLYMISSATGENPGLGWSNENALALYGWYTMLVYLMSIPGGIFADKYVGQKKAVLIGGLILVLGHSVLAITAPWAFFLGLALIVIGVGGLKPNISTMVGGLYPPNDERRDGGFTIFYIGINIGAFLAAIIVGFVGEKIGWHRTKIRPPIKQLFFVPHICQQKFLLEWTLDILTLYTNHIGQEHFHYSTLVLGFHQ